MVEQFFLFSCLFWLIYEIYKENYQLSNSLTEIFYDFHNDPVLLYEEETQSIKVNSMFVNSFGHLIKRRKLFHHSQMLTEILNPHEIVFECLQDGVKKISLEQVLNQQEQMSKKELILRKVEGDKTFMFTFYRLENLYDSKTVCVFKETTHIHELQKVADRVRSVIMGCLTHELRTPVNWVISIFRSLEDYIDDSDEARKLFMICQGTIEMLRSLTEDFIDFTRFENEKGLPIKMENIKIDEFMKSIENIFKFQAEEKDLQFMININPSVPCDIYTDPKRLKQVLLNLLSNAFKFTQRGKIEIKIDTKTVMKQTSVLGKTIGYGNVLPRRIFDCQFKTIEEQKISSKHLRSPTWYTHFKDSTITNRISMKYSKILWIEVIDTGIGMTEEEHGKLFIKFGTGMDSKNLNTNGLGLGLYLSKEITNKLGGDIKWESMPGIGSTFSIELPLDSKNEIKWLLKENDAVFGRHNTISQSMNFKELEFDEHINAKGVKESIAFDENYHFYLSKSTVDNSNLISEELELSDSHSSRNSSNYKEDCKRLVIRESIGRPISFAHIKRWDCKSVLIVDDLAFNILLLKHYFNSKNIERQVVDN